MTATDTNPNPCKSKTHVRYGEALEGLYIQTWMAHRDLAKLLEELGGEPGPSGHADANSKGTELALNEYKLDAVTDRIAFGKGELEKARRDVDEHLARGCRNMEWLDAQTAALAAERS